MRSDAGRLAPQALAWAWPWTLQSLAQAHAAAAWRTAVSVARPGARVAVVDMARPARRARALTPLALAATRLGGADIDAHPWTALEQECTDVTAVSLRGGHVQVRVGTLP